MAKIKTGLNNDGHKPWQTWPSMLWPSWFVAVTTSSFRLHKNFIVSRPRNFYADRSARLAESADRARLSNVMRWWHAANRRSEDSRHDDFRHTTLTFPLSLALLPPPHRNLLHATQNDTARWRLCVLPHQRLWTFDVLVCPVHCRRQSVSCCSRSSCGTVFHRTTLPPPSLSIFCCRLKSHLFSLSYPAAFWLFCHLYSAVTQGHFGHYYRFQHLTF